MQSTYRPYPTVPPRTSNRWLKWVVGSVVGIFVCGLIGLIVLAVLAASKVSDVLRDFPGNKRRDLKVALEFYDSDAMPCAIAGSEDRRLWAVGYEGLGTESGVAVHYDNHIYMAGDWDLEHDALSEFFQSANGEKRRVPDRPVREGPVDIRFLPGTNQLVYASSEMRRVLVASRGERADSKGEYPNVRRFEVMEMTPLALDVSPDSVTVAVACGQTYDYPDSGFHTNPEPKHGIVLWDIKSGKRITTVDDHKAAVRCVVFMDNTSFISGGNDATLRIWSLNEAKLIRTIDAEAPVTSVSLSRDRKSVAYCTERGHIIVLDLDSRTRRSLHDDVTEAPTQRGRTTTHVCALFSPDGKWLAVGRGGKVNIYGADDLKLTYVQEVAIGQGVHALAWSADSERIGAAYGHAATVWSMP